MTPTTWQEAAAAAGGEIHTEMATLRMSQDQLAQIVDDTILRMADRERYARIDGVVYEHPRHEFVGIAVTAINGYQQATGDRDAMSTVLRTIAGKQRDYGHDNIARFGVTGLVVRLSDKAARLLNLLKRQDASAGEAIDAFAEPITDTWLDIAGYCVLALMWIDGGFMLPLAEDVA